MFKRLFLYGSIVLLFSAQIGNAKEKQTLLCLRYVGLGESQGFLEKVAMELKGKSWSKAIAGMWSFLRRARRKVKAEFGF